MKLFHQSNRETNDHTRRLYARYELAHTLTDFGAASLFFIGSVLFFWKALEVAAIWCFVVGSVLFMVKPTLRLVREVHLYRAGNLKTLADAEAGSLG